MNCAVMLRKRSRPVGSSKQTIVSDHNNNNLASASTEKPHKPTSYLFNSPKIFKDFFLLKDHQTQQATTMISPSSVLDTKPLFPSVLPTSHHLWIDSNKIQTPKTLPSAKHSWEHPGIGLALIDNGDGDDKERSPHVVPTTTMAKTCTDRSKLVVFGSQLKIQIPASPPSPSLPCIPTSSPNSPMEFGIKTPKSNLLGVAVNSSNYQKKKETFNDRYGVVRRLHLCDLSWPKSKDHSHIWELHCGELF